MWNGSSVMPVMCMCSVPGRLEADVGWPRTLLSGLHLPNVPRRLQAIKHGHLLVHQNDMRPGAGHGGHTFAAIARARHVNLDVGSLLSQLLPDGDAQRTKKLSIYLDVINDQNGNHFVFLFFFLLVGFGGFDGFGNDGTVVLSLVLGLLELLELLGLLETLGLLGLLGSLSSLSSFGLLGSLGFRLPSCKGLANTLFPSRRCCLTTVAYSHEWTRSKRGRRSACRAPNTAWCLANPVKLMTTTPPATSHQQPASFAPVAAEAKHVSASATTTGHEDSWFRRTYSRKGVGAHTSNTFRCDRLRGGSGGGRDDVAAPFNEAGW